MAELFVQRIHLAVVILTVTLCFLESGGFLVYLACTPKLGDLLPPWMAVVSAAGLPTFLTFYINF